MRDAGKQITLDGSEEDETRRALDVRILELLRLGMTGSAEAAWRAYNKCGGYLDFEWYVGIAENRKQTDCPNCGQKLHRTAGCERCTVCGYSGCE
jgi:hypothetical protein